MVSKTFGDQSGTLSTGDLDTNFDELQASVDQNTTASSAALLAAQQATTDVATLQQNVAGQRNISGDVLNSGNTLEQELAAIRALVSGAPYNPPTVDASPSIAPTDPDVGETVTITAGTYTANGNGQTVTSRTWQVFINGSLYTTIASTSYVVPAAAGQGARQISFTELGVWANGVVQSPTVTYTVNAPAAYSMVITSPSITGTAAVGATITLNSGTYTNTPTSYEYNVYRGGTPAQGGTLVESNSQAGATRNYTVVSDDAAATLVLGIYVTNAVGENPQEYYSTAVVVGGGTAPTYNSASAVLPGFVPGTYEVGQTITLDFGAPINNPNPLGYQFQLTRDGSDITGQSAPSAGSGTNVANNRTYLLRQEDQNKTLAFRVRASNAAGQSEWAYAAGIYIEAAGVGGGGTGVLTWGAPVDTGWAQQTVSDYGTVDWAFFDNATFASCEQKASPGAVQVTGYTGFGAFSPIPGGYPYTGGTPTASGTMGWELSVIDGPSGTGTATADADATQRTAHLFIVVWDGTVTITASLSDSSADPQQVQVQGGAGTTWRIPLVYKADSGSQTLTLTFTQASGAAWVDTWLDAIAIGA